MSNGEFDIGSFELSGFNTMVLANSVQFNSLLLTCCINSQKVQLYFGYKDSFLKWEAIIIYFRVILRHVTKGF
jgi:hypothetical protein